MKKLLKKYFPFTLYIGVFNSFLKGALKYVKYSSVVKDNSSEKLISKIIADYHVIEKGLTMPETRLGFGKDRMIQLMKYCEKYIKHYGNKGNQIIHAVNVINEYKEFHGKLNYTLDKDIIDKIENLQKLSSNLTSSSQKHFLQESYYANIDSRFEKFSKSRLSVRNYSDKNIEIGEIEKAVDLAKQCPSSCNRQTVRANVYTDKKLISKILQIQGGNRGFGHLANKLIILTSDLSYWHGVSERNGPYVDGGIFAMNLLYALHSLKIASCPLNCNLSPGKEKALRKICNIPDSEVFIVMISCGYVPDEFKVPYSKRYEVEDILRINN